MNQTNKTIKIGHNDKNAKRILTNPIIDVYCKIWQEIKPKE